MKDRPAYVTHYHLPDRAPFLNLSDLDPGEQTAVMAELDRMRLDGRQHRPFGRAYVELRRRVEQRLYDAAIAAGTRPDRRAPHYFVLGASSWYEALAPGMRSLRVPLTELPPGATTITYPDSFVAFGDAPPDDPAIQPHYRRVYLLHELDALLANNPLPAPAWQPEHASDWTTWPTATFIEVQVWSDDPTPERARLKAGDPTRSPAGA